MLPPDNIFHAVPAELPAELFQTLLETPAVKVERILSRGHASPAGFWYEQATREWVLVLSGRARVSFEGESSIELVPGAFVDIPARRRHRVDWTDPNETTIWLAIHIGEASGPNASGAEPPPRP
jgi:cupin 2 domain-containing protein